MRGLSGFVHEHRAQRLVPIDQRLEGVVKGFDIDFAG
jgi:hypothetical protein